MTNFLRVFFSALIATSLLAVIDLAGLVAEGVLPPRPLWFVGQLGILTFAVATFLAGMIWLGIRIHRLALRQLHRLRWGRLTSAIDVVLWSLLWTGVAFSYLLRLAVEISKSPGYLRSPWSDALSPWILPLIALFTLAVFGWIRVDMRRSEKVETPRIAIFDFFLLLVIIVFLFVDGTFFIAYYDLYHFFLGAIAFLATGYVVYRRLWRLELPSGNSTLAGPQWATVLGALCVISLSLTLIGPAFRWPPHAETVLLHTKHTKRAARFLRKHSDWDGDHFPRLFGGGDPNDWDASSHPLSVDVPGDGIDQDGDGADRTSEEDRWLRSRLIPEDRDLAEFTPPVRRVILVTIDGFRADRLNARGEDGEPLLPHIRSLAERGIVFERVYSPTARTLGTFRVILSGSPYHPDSVQSFLPTLGAGSIHTAFITPQLLLQPLIDQLKQMDGFDELVGSAYTQRQGWNLLRGWIYLEEPTAAASTDSALAWIERNREALSFLWIHYFDSHEWHDLELGEHDGKMSDDQRYDQVLRLIDSEFGRVTEWLEARGELGRTAIIVAGDHGEGLGDHGVRSHSLYVWESIVRVPLVVFVPGIVSGTVEAPVSLVSLGPSIVDLLDPVCDRAREGSLLPSLFSKSASSKPIFLSEERQMAVVEGNWKLIFNFKDCFFQLYDLSVDPEESRNRLTEESETYHYLRSLLALHLEQEPILSPFQFGDSR